MPTVPTYDTPQVAPAGLPNVQIQGLSPRQLMQGEIAGHEQEAAGQAVQNLGVQGLDAEAKANIMANQVRVDAALNDVRAAQQKLTYDPAAGYLSLKGSAALQPNDQGQGLADQYGQKMSDAVSAASASLANDAQRQVFMRSAAQLQTQFSGQVQSHVAQESKTFGLQTQQGTVDIASDTARRNWFDPNAISSNPDDQANSVILQNVASAKAAVWKAGQISGEPANLVQAKMQEVESQIHSGVIMAALQNNRPDYAQSYLQKFAPSMGAGDLLKSQQLVQNDVQARSATSVAQNAIGSYRAAFSPSASDRMLEITRQTESSGNPNAVGPYIEGQGTAKGSMQVMDGTNLDPGFGVKPAADNSPTERARVGADYLGALVKKYAGDPAKAWAAYNAGPGNVDKAIKDAESQGDPGIWLQALGEYQSDANHAQTVAYVTKNVEQLQKGGGVPPMPTLQDIHDQIRTAIGPNAAPALVSKALSEGSRQFSDAMAARKEQAEQAVTAAQTYLAQNNGDFNSLPPDLHAQVVALAPDKLPGLQTFANSIAQPPVKDNMVAYHTAFEHPEELAAMPDSTFQHFVTTNFGEATQKQLGTLRQNAINGKIDTGPGSINETVFTRELNNRLQTIGLLDEKGKPLDRGQVGTISNFLRNAALDQQRQTGQKMTEDQLVKYVDGQFLKSTELPGMLWGSTIKPTLSLTTSDIPSDQLDQVKAALAKQGNKQPSDDQIMRTYWARSGK